MADGRPKISVVFTALFVFVMFVPAHSQKVSRCHVQDQDVAPKYRLGRVKRELLANESTPALLLQISVRADAFTSKQMNALANRLRKEYCTEDHLNVLICDDYQCAKDDSLIHDLIAHEPNAAMRGVFDLKRTTGEDSLIFSTERGRPLNEIELRFDNRPAGNRNLQSPVPVLHMQRTNCEAEGKQTAPEYKVGQSKRAMLDGVSILALQISVEPQFFDRKNMIALASRLKKDFCNEQQIAVAICDNYQCAKSKDLITSHLMKHPHPALRGGYDLNRTAGTESISFSSERGKPLNEIEIKPGKQ